MFKLKTKPRIVEVTKELARKFCDMQSPKNDRPLRESILKRLRDAFNKGEFRICDWATAHCLENDQVYRVNGKHTSTLLAELGAKNKIPKGLNTIISEYEVPDMEWLARLYNTFDPKESSRWAGDTNWIVAGIYPEFQDIPKKVINLCISALGYEKWGRNAWQRPAIERALLILDEIDFCSFVKEILSGDCWHVRRAPIVAAMLHTFRKGQAASLEFWKAVRDETGNDPTDADRKLAKWLNRVRINIGSSSKKRRGIEAVSFHEAAIRGVQLFILWRKKEKVIKMPPYNPSIEKFPAIV